MRTALGTDCKGEHRNNGHLDSRMWNVYELNGRRYTVCAHSIPSDNGQAYCGEWIDVTGLPAVAICCGNDANHRGH